MTKAKQRCALYTRKSSEDGLEQSFNSLDAQREACAAYVRSQAGEGWRAIPTLYDDGGHSGGSMDRPALQRLLADIAAGKVDVVVVYKIDRLTRSLMDFARIVELFDRHRVSFVSVTQAFNTTSSMGRLTLNVLLSFAQFEREVTGERIRDKIAASKAKGMWMGGHLPLGYDLPADGGRALTVNEAEAETVRTIYQAYLDHGSVHALEHWLAARDIRSKQRVTANGRVLGGVRFSRGALFHLLRNRVYLGMIVHKDKVHSGMHPAIVDADLFDAVQARLDSNARRFFARGETGEPAPLARRIFDADGEPMSPTASRGARGKVYRYYVSAPLQQGDRRSREDDAIRRVPAAALEARLAEIIRRTASPNLPDPLSLVTRVEVHAKSLQLLMPVAHMPKVRDRLIDGERADVDPADPSQLRLTIPIRMRLHGGRTWIIGGKASAPPPHPVLVTALRTAHAMVLKDANGMPIVETAPASPYARRLVRLAFLAPDLQRAILAGSQPPGLTLSQLMVGPVPLLWTEQVRVFNGAK
ncbi:MAG: recombinase family protein [Bauldia sp.]|nr:recombinase family protein [Bauldia sp.]